MLRYLLPLGIFVVLAGFLYVGLGLDPRDIGSTRLDKPAPTFSLPQVTDLQEKMSDTDFKGKVSLFNVWASWCQTCRYEHPLLMQLSQQTQIPIYGLNFKDKIEAARQILQQEGNPYLASGFDEKGMTGIDWGVTGTPETFVVDKQGIVRLKWTGPLTVEALQNKILPLIKTLQKQ